MISSKPGPILSYPLACGLVRHLLVGVVVLMATTSCSGEKSAGDADSSDADDTSVTTADTDTSTDTDAEQADAVDTSDDADPGADADVADSLTDTLDASDTDAGGRVQGTVPLSDFIPCDDDTDCRSGTGNCIVEIPFNRTYDDSPTHVTIAELAPGWPMAGVCSRACSDQANACDDLRLPQSTVPYVCQVVAVSAAPYALVGGKLPDLTGLEPAEQTLGQPFAALCVPPFKVTASWPPDFCEPCDAESACEAGSVCWLDQPFAAAPATVRGACLAPCDVDCPIGFACEVIDPQRGATLADAGVGTYCVPLQGTCGACRDADGDGFGTGLCDGNGATSHDCDDAVPWAWFDADDMAHSFPDICGDALDANCNGVGDLYEQIGTEEFGSSHCTACLDACSGAVSHGSRLCAGGAAAPTCGLRCDDPSAWVDCDDDPETGCETAADDPARQFYPDCDGDEVPADVAPTFDCAGVGAVTITVGEQSCAGVLAVEQDGVVVFDCHDDDGDNTPGAVEVCDGADNDCNGGTDDTPLLVSGDLQCTAAGDAKGECAANGTWACDLASGGAAEVCVPALATAELCDGLDNDCDGETDEQTADGAIVAGGDCPMTGGTFATTIDGSTNLCRTGKWLCSAGGYVCDAYVVPAATRCENTCVGFAGICEDGGFLSSSWQCALGTDCAACGVRSWTDWPGDGFDEDCDGFDGDLDHAVFVRQLGNNTSGTGAPGAAYRTIDKAWAAIEARRDGDARVYQLILAVDLIGGAEFKNGPIEIRPRAGFRTTHREGAMFGIFGGYTFENAVSWTPGGRNRLTFPSTLCATGDTCRGDVSHADYLPMVNVKAPMDVRIANVTIKVDQQAWQRREPADLFTDNVVGLSCECGLGIGQSCLFCENLTLTEVEISMARGASGADGAAGAEGEKGYDAVQPNVNSLDFIAPDPWMKFCGTRRDCDDDGCVNVGFHSRGGSGGTVFDPPNTTAYDCGAGSADYVGGDGGNSSDSPNREAGGDGGLGGHMQERSPQDGVAGEDAYTSTAVAAGGAGASPFSLNPGTEGQTGVSGGGGGGGGGGWSFECTVLSALDFDGNHGTGGASGGCGGNGGAGGQPGRTTIGLLVEGLFFPTLEGSLTIALDGGGDGGHGGAAGSGGFGGVGAEGINLTDAAGAATFDFVINEPGAGAKGGDGASGAGGGGGAGGWCIGVYRVHGADFSDTSITFDGSCASDASGGAGGAKAPSIGSGHEGTAGEPGEGGDSWLRYPE